MLKWINKKRNKKGFTLVELVVVIAILGILAAIAVPRLAKQTSNAKLVSDQASARNIIGAINVAVAAGDAEIATDKIKIKQALTEGTVPTDANSEQVLAALKLLSYLDEVPTPQAGGKNYVIKVADSVVEIYNDDTTPKKLYPVK